MECLLGWKKYFDVKWAVENNPLAAATFRANKKDDVQVYTEDLKAFLRKSVQGDPCYPSAGEVDHIHASPPCKGFSRANRSGGKEDSKNNKQTLLVVKAIEHFQPKTVSFENVPGLILDDFKGYLQFLVSSLLQMSYQLRVQILSSSSFGDPQKRRRLILLAARSDCMLPTMPSPTHTISPTRLASNTCTSCRIHVWTRIPTLMKMRRPATLPPTTASSPSRWEDPNNGNVTGKTTTIWRGRSTGKKSSDDATGKDSKRAVLFRHWYEDEDEDEDDAVKTVEYDLLMQSLSCLIVQLISAQRVHTCTFAFI